MSDTAIYITAAKDRVPVFEKIASEAGYKSFRNVEGLRNYIISNPLKGNHILIKGSRGIMLEKIYDLL